MVIILKTKSYYLSKDKKKKEVVYLEYEKMDGYRINPKTRGNAAIEVSKVIFVNPEISEKIIRKKIDKKIDYFLKQLNTIDEEDSGDHGTIKNTLMAAEELRLQIINNYVKYLGNTYGSLTLKKMQIITDNLKYKLYMMMELEKEKNYFNVEESKRSR